MLWSGLPTPRTTQVPAPRRHTVHTHQCTGPVRKLPKLTVQFYTVVTVYTSTSSVLRLVSRVLNCVRVLGPICLFRSAHFVLAILLQFYDANYSKQNTRNKTSYYAVISVWSEGSGSIHFYYSHADHQKQNHRFEFEMMKGIWYRTNKHRHLFHLSPTFEFLFTC